MKDFDGNIIYIGKSKSLKSRVKSYFQADHKSNKTKIMVFNIYDIDYIVTDTHLEAQMLECTLIKKLQPIYNIQFKNDKRYKYLKVEDYNKFKIVSIVHEKENEYCFGPYRNKNILFDMIMFFQNIYPISKYDNTYEFYYKILPEQIEKNTFKNNKESLIEIFNNKECMINFLYKLEKFMDKAALELKFEAATMYRDMIYNIKYLYDNNTNKFNKIKSKKILMGEKIDAGYKIFYISDYRIIFKKKYIKLTKENIEEFIIQAQESEGKLPNIIDEKRNLDFKKIIRNELTSEDSKTLLFRKLEQMVSYIL